MTEPSIDDMDDLPVGHMYSVPMIGNFADFGPSSAPVIDKGLGWQNKLIADIVNLQVIYRMQVDYKIRALNECGPYFRLECVTDESGVFTGIELLSLYQSREAAENAKNKLLAQYAHYKPTAKRQVKLFVSQQAEFNAMSMFCPCIDEPFNMVCERYARHCFGEKHTEDNAIKTE